jgi:hypothetical protein
MLRRLQVSFIWTSPVYAKRHVEREADGKAKNVEPYLTRRALRDAVPPLKHQVRDTIPYLERQAMRAAAKARADVRTAERESDN